MRLFRKKISTLKRFQKTEKYPIEPVFEVGGVTYYSFSDINNQPAGRTLAAIPMYIELKTNCDKDYLTVFVAGMEAVLNDNTKISIEKLITLKNQIKDRLTWGFTPDLIYKYASVMYFDENENPATYDQIYNDRKIAFWKEHMTVESFFLTEPIQRLVPALTGVKDSLKNYSDVILKAQAYQLDKLSDLIFTSKISKDETLNLNSVITALKRRYSSDHYPLTNTFSSLTEKRNTVKS